MRNQTSDLWILCSDALPLNLKETLWSCIMLGSAMLLVSCFVNRIRKMVSFELGKEKEKEAVLSCCEHGTNKKL